MSLPQDLRFAARSLRAHAGTTAFAILTLATGLAAALAIYCVIDALLLRDLPYRQPERLVQVNELARDGRRMALAYPNYADLAASVEAFDATAYYGGGDGPVSSGTVIRRASATLTGGDFFRALGVAPLLGRTYDARERDHVAVISHALWQGLLQGRPDVLGRTIDAFGEQWTIAGVMPAGFAFPQDSALWMPMLDDPGTSRSAHNWSVLARLKDAGALAPARLAANALASRLTAQYGSEIDATGFAIVPLREAVAAPVRDALLLLATGVGFLLLIAVTNTTNLLLALNGARTRELAVRAALGASQARLARQVFAEGALIAAAACAIAFALASAAIRLLAHGAGTRLPRAAEIGIGFGTVALTVGAALAIALVTTMAVLFSQRRRSTSSELRESGRGQSPGRAHLRLRTALLIGQTALTTVLLVGTGLLGRSFLALLAIDPGFDANSAMTVQLSRPATRDAAVAAETARRYDALIDELRAVPGVTAVGGVNGLPLTDEGADGAFWDGSVSDIAHAPQPIGYAEFRVASGDYFKRRRHAPAARTHLRCARPRRRRARRAGQRGRRARDLGRARSDRPAHPVRQHGRRHARAHDRRRGRRRQRAPARPCARRHGLRESGPTPALGGRIQPRSALEPAAGNPRADAAAGARTARGRHPARARTAGRRARDAALADRHLGLMLLGAFAGVAFVLAIGGLYGLMAFAVGQREHEFALRQALGSSRRGIAALVLGRGLRIGAVGVALGVLAALSGARAVRGLLYGVPASDPVTLFGVSVLLLGTLLLACLLPARRACATNPRDALG